MSLCFRCVQRHVHAIARLICRSLIPTEKLINMAEFVLKNNYLEFNGSVKQQVSGAAIGTKCAPTYACIYTDEVETEFLETQERAPLVLFRYIDDIFFIWTHGKEHLEIFLQELKILIQIRNLLMS